MTRQDSNQKSSKNFVKSVMETQTAVGGAKIVEITKTNDGAITLHIHGENLDDQYRMIINGDFEVVGESVITEDDKEKIQEIDKANEEAFKKAMKSDEEVLYDAIVSKVKSLWN